jgi:hypothetical protein
MVVEAGDLIGARDWMCLPEMALAMISRWISEVPSKIVSFRSGRSSDAGMWR